MLGSLQGIPWLRTFLLLAPRCAELTGSPFPPHLVVCVGDGQAGAQDVAIQLHSVLSLQAVMRWQAFAKQRVCVLHSSLCNANNW